MVCDLVGWGGSLAEDQEVHGGEHSSGAARHQARGHIDQHVVHILHASRGQPQTAEYPHSCRVDLDDTGLLQPLQPMVPATASSALLQQTTGEEQFVDPG